MTKLHSTVSSFLDQFWFSPGDVLVRSAEASIWSTQKFSHPILDIGCGDGKISKNIYPLKTIDTGLDLDPLAADQARLSFFYKHVVCADATRLPFANGKFQCVLANSTLEHIDLDTQVISEISRVLRKGGNFMFTVPTPRLEKILSHDLTGRLAHLHYRNISNWTNILSHSGFKIESYNYYFPDNLVNLWVKLLRVSTVRIFHRELWSYLKDSPYGKLVPAFIIKPFLCLLLAHYVPTVFSSSGTWLFISARKI